MVMMEDPRPLAKAVKCALQRFDGEVFADVEVGGRAIPHGFDTWPRVACHHWDERSFVGIDREIAEGWRGTQVGCEGIAAETAIGGRAAHVAPIKIVFKRTDTGLNLETAERVLFGAKTQRELEHFCCSALGGVGQNFDGGPRDAADYLVAEHVDIAIAAAEAG
jgi:hypothetical protein